MITLPRTVRVWAYGRPVDLRKGYNGLVGIVENELRSDPMGGELYLFVNGKRTGCKVLLWDGTGLCIFMNQPSSHYTSFDSRRGRSTGRARHADGGGLVGRPVDGEGRAAAELALE